jgi:hypothetical protein
MPQMVSPCLKPCIVVDLSSDFSLRGSIHELFLTILSYRWWPRLRTWLVRCHYAPDQTLLRDHMKHGLVSRDFYCWHVALSSGRGVLRICRVCSGYSQLSSCCPPTTRTGCNATDPHAGPWYSRNLKSLEARRKHRWRTVISK